MLADNPLSTRAANDTVSTRVRKYDCETTLLCESHDRCMTATGAFYQFSAT